MGPADWRFERLPIPPGFARDIQWTGYEEARFAPGMFDTQSTNYFTYALAVSIEDKVTVTDAHLKDFLDKYFKGLSTAVGRRKGLTPDPAQLGATVTAVKAESEADSPTRFSATVPFFDTFNDGRKLLLNLEITVHRKPDSGKILLVMLISPQPKDAPAWTRLRAIGKTVEEPKP